MEQITDLENGYYIVHETEDFQILYKYWCEFDRTPKRIGTSSFVIYHPETDTMFSKEFRNAYDAKLELEKSIDLPKEKQILMVNIYTLERGTLLKTPIKSHIQNVYIDVDGKGPRWERLDMWAPASADNIAYALMIKQYREQRKYFEDKIEEIRKEVDLDDDFLKEELLKYIDEMSKDGN